MSDPTDASTNSIPKYEADPKDRCDPRRAASSPPGFYPYGIATGETGIEDYLPDADDSVQITPPSILPRRPNAGEMLSNTPGANAPQSIMGKRRN